MKSRKSNRIFARRRNRPVRTRKRTSILNKLPPPDTKRIQTLGAGNLLSHVTIPYSHKFAAGPDATITPDVISIGQLLQADNEFLNNKSSFKYYKILAIKLIKFPYNTTGQITHFNVYLDWGARNYNYTYEYMQRVDTVKRIPLYSLRVLNYKFKPPNATIPVNTQNTAYINLRNFKTCYDEFSLPINLVTTPIRDSKITLDLTITYTIEILIQFRGNEYMSTSGKVNYNIDIIEDVEELNKIKAKIEEKLQNKENKKINKHKRKHNKLNKEENKEEKKEDIKEENIKEMDKSIDWKEISDSSSEHG